MNYRIPGGEGKTFVRVGGGGKKSTYAVFAVEHESNVDGLCDSIGTWGHASRLYRLFPQAGGLRGDNDFPEPSRDSTEGEKVPWIEMDHNLLEEALAVSIVDLEGRARQQTRSKSSMGRLDTCRGSMEIREKVEERREGGSSKG